ncbi:ferric-chelate reductase, putative [Talaromyces stipitatus ATCC 10500]|uniref:ferric-chelate reductase (NADPH) n=1 Tax=Talaromyces stipitatus (strain ATCC 10500 / CBS 375.48 / QM 6759 / NRRL 1006) TaxID=441959 RepID=B8M4C7_TALSN|nr:ferric-chelate reductase, putative [Talaromyces stipitatus ATCC 10500]EED19122.1 ferric-chelate reductase, putative [Talaromyces stipitatus ATCC 10500]
MAAWLSQPVQLHSSRKFNCEDITPEECEYYYQRWHYWYEADHVFALPTVAFFMCTIGIFIIARVISRTLSYRIGRGLPIWRRIIAAVRYLSYRGFYVKKFRWSSPSVGLLMLASIGTTYFFCMDLAPKPYYWPNLNWGNSPALGTRSGWLALACMPFVFATASKANWITLLTGVPHEKLQVFHRWISYAFFILALMHTFSFIVYHIRNADMVHQITESNTLVYWTGIVALVLQAWLTFASFSFFRNLGYEFFKAAHIFAVIVFMLIFFWHCNFRLTSWDYFIATAAVYIPCLLYSWLRTFFEYGIGQKAQIVIEDNGFTRITIPANFEWVPGQHCFLRFPSFGIHALTSHPFTICSLPSVSPHEQSNLTFYIRHQGGFTAKLYNYATKQASVSAPVLIDGPYGGIDRQKFYNSDHVIVITGGSGAGWSLPFIEQFCRHYLSMANKTNIPNMEASDEEKNTSGDPQSLVSTLSMRVVLATRESATSVWFQRRVGEILSQHSLEHSSLDLDLQVYVTSETKRDSYSPGVLADQENAVSLQIVGDTTTQKDNEKGERMTCNLLIQEQHSRPPLPLIIQEEAAKVAEARQSLGVFVCGPHTMQNDVRNAVAKENLRLVNNPSFEGVYLHMEHFSWA